MLEYYNKTLCASAKVLEDSGILSLSNFKKLAIRGRVKVVRKGGGNGNYALVAVDSLPEKYRKLVHEKFPNGGETRLAGWVRLNYERDQNAWAFFSDPSLCGAELSEERIEEYTVNAGVLQACIKMYDRASTASKNAGESYNWEMMASAVEALKKEYQHTLPTSMNRFRRKVAEYRKFGYSCLISGKYGNQSARKVNHKIEQVILGLACLPNKPFHANVAEMYISFVCGELDVYDISTGELFDPDEFVDKNGEPLILSEATIINYLNKPKNKVLIDSKTLSRNAFRHEIAPHTHRHNPEFSLSKVSLDDRDLPRKLVDTKERPKAYYAYDVTSGYVIGRAYSRRKNRDLVLDCFRDMFQFLDRNNLNIPAQMEVENHLMSEWRNSFLKAGEMFPFVRFCAPENHQEKHAEPLNGAKKKSIEHKNHLGIGRFYGKGKWRTESKKVYDDRNDQYEDKEYYTWEQLIEEDRRDIDEWNNSLHGNQKMYPGMTRKEVFFANINPTLKPYDKARLAKYIGEKVETSIRRSSYCRVNYTDWWISGTEVLGRLAPNNYEVQAYCLRDEAGEIKDVYIYQGDKFIDRLDNVGTFNTADCEKTDDDHAVMADQMSRINEFHGWVKDNTIAPLGIAPRYEIPEEIETLPMPIEPSSNEDHMAVDYAAKAMEDML